VLDGQRLVSLDTLLGLGEGLNELAQGKDVGDTLLPLAGQLKEFEMPRPMFIQWRTQRMGSRVLQRAAQFPADADRPGQDHQVQQSKKELIEARGLVVPSLGTRWWA
jgi:hypothetical protein